MANYFCTDSVEEQVDYLTDKVKELKQADVTINDNLQTMNTEINGKLTAPTNPSAESAVTMLADGTVGTKPLSEIGGSGGDVKLYLHKIHASFTTEPGGIYIDIINTSNITLTENQYFRTYIGYGTVVCFNGMHGDGAVSISYIASTENYTVKGAIVNSENTGYYLNFTDTFQSFDDTVTEL